MGIMVERTLWAMLTDQMRESGVKVDAAVPAWSGHYPLYSAHVTWSLLLKGWLLLVKDGDEVSLWDRPYPIPTEKVLTVPVNAVRVLHEGRRYDRLVLGSTRVWVPCEYRSTIESWLAEPDA